jgi:YegS/Rv2252/BmrU family lipid kinase
MRPPAAHPDDSHVDRPPAGRVGTVAVVAHQKKSLGGGLDELRRRITDEGVQKLLWYEVPKSKKAGKQARRAVQEGAELVFVWGGDGMVQRCLDALAGSTAVVAIVPAGTANLLAGSLDIPADVQQAVRIGFAGRRHRLDLGKVNGEHFAVMAGVGLDAQMLADSDRSAKERAGRLAYFWSALRHTRDASTPVRIRIDGRPWFSGEVSCVLLGNVGTIAGGIQVFDDARPDDGWLEVGVATASGTVQWARTMARMVAGRSDRSPFVRITRARRVDVKLGKPLAYELDGGVRKATRRLKVRLVPAAVTVCRP